MSMCVETHASSSTLPWEVLEMNPMEFLSSVQLHFQNVLLFSAHHTVSVSDKSNKYLSLPITLLLYEKSLNPWLFACVQNEQNSDYSVMFGWRQGPYSNIAFFRADTESARCKWMSTSCELPTYPPWLQPLLCCNFCYKSVNLNF